MRPRIRRERRHVKGLAHFRHRSDSLGEQIGLIFRK